MSGTRSGATSVRVLLAPDKFKGTFTAREVCELVSAGLGESGGETLSAPMADGGDGTATTLRDALGGRCVEVDVTDALGRPIVADYSVLDGPGDIAVVDVAAASGLSLIAPGERDSFAATSYGTGALIAHAARDGASTIIVGAGGSATTDGGVGLLEALAEVTLPRIVVACDVITPWERAALVFGPQKGASSAEVRQLESRLDGIASRLAKDPRGVPMSGCAGGIAGALWASHDAELVSGARLVWDMLGLDRRLECVDVVITGEGRLDEQTREGKVVAEVARRATDAGLPCHAVVGSLALDRVSARRLGLERIVEAATRSELVAAGPTLVGAL